MKLRAFDFWAAVVFTVASYGAACYSALRNGWPQRIDLVVILLVTFAAGLIGQGTQPLGGTDGR